MPICTQSSGLAGSFKARTHTAEAKDFIFWLIMQRSESEFDKKDISQVQSWVGDKLLNLSEPTAQLKCVTAKDVCWQ